MNLDKFLSENCIKFTRYEHPPVFTCEEAAKVNLPGIHNKNLFLSDTKKEKYFLVTAQASKPVDLKELATLLEVKKLRFGSAEELNSILKIEPGSVSLLAVINDDANRVKVFIDQEVWENGQIQCHPLINTATLVIERKFIEEFILATGHPPATIIRVPQKLLS